MPLLHTLPFIAYLLAGLLLTRYFLLDTVTSQHRLVVNLMLLVAVSSHGYILFEMWQHNGVFFWAHCECFFCGMGCSNVIVSNLLHKTDSLFGDAGLPTQRYSCDCLLFVSWN